MGDTSSRPLRLEVSDCVYLISSQANHITVYGHSVSEYNDGFKKLWNNVCRSRMYLQPETTKYLTKLTHYNEQTGTDGDR